METYSGYVIFYNKGNKICGTWIRGKDDDEILSNAIFNIMCHYPNVIYDDLEIIEKRL